MYQIKNEIDLSIATNIRWPIINTLKENHVQTKYSIKELIQDFIEDTIPAVNFYEISRMEYFEIGEII